MKKDKEKQLAEKHGGVLTILPSWEDLNIQYELLEDVEMLPGEVAL